MKDEKQKWASEPWSVTPHEEAEILDSNGQQLIRLKESHLDSIEYAERRATVFRIVSCVNALAGVPNPQEFVEAANGAIEDFKIFLREFGDDSHRRRMPVLFTMVEKSITRFEKAFGKV